MRLEQQLTASLKTSFIDKEYLSEELYQTKLILNKPGEKVLDTLLSDMEDCEEFKFSIAFITEGGLASIIGMLESLARKRIPGKILTTDYLNFSDPKALKRLSQFPNIELRVYHGDFHTKGYIFKKRNLYNAIIGSSNLTQTALCTNKEWNLKITSTEQGNIIDKMLDEFECLWNQGTKVDDLWLENYQCSYQKAKTIHTKVSEEEAQYQFEKELQPNKMQQAALQSLDGLRRMGKKKALLISATGTGKTYLSAFDVAQVKPKRLLFLVHREQILKQAQQSFERVIGDRVTYGILSGNHKEVEADYLFSTVQMMSKPECYQQFSPDVFDYIIIDESHRSGAASYQRILNYFHPQFLLGMTATPERTDGINIYELFDYNIAYEIRLQEALEMNLLCPFHYYGIADMTFDNGKKMADYEQLPLEHKIDEKRVDYIIEKLEFYGYSGERVKGVVFCSKTKEAQMLSEKFNQRGYHTVALTAKHQVEEREAAIRRLTQNETEGALDYIFTVDIFNEGIDIPEINQVVMLRETESVIVFIQQLGRGLRKCIGKEFVNIIDFIGNYRNNYMIPIALTGGETGNKDTNREKVYQGTSLPGCSTVYFDEIAKERIYQSINQAKFNKSFFVEKFKKLKEKIGRVPLLVDFYKEKDIDPLLLLQYKNYYEFLLGIGENADILSEQAILYLTFVYSQLANGQRPHELVILKQLLTTSHVSKENVIQILHKDFSLNHEEESIESAIRVLEGHFLVGTTKLTEVTLIGNDEGQLYLLPELSTLLHQNYFKRLWEDALDLGLLRYREIYSDLYKDTKFKLYEKYSRRDVCRLLNWDKNEEATVNGYPSSPKKGSIPLFVTYHKNEEINESTKYEDRFLNQDIFSWMSRTRRTMSSKEIKNILNSKEEATSIHLFIKKNDSEGKSFYYMGLVNPLVQAAKETQMQTQKAMLPVVNIPFQLETQVERSLYNYLCN